MNLHFSAFVTLGKKLAHERNAQWDISLDESGQAIKGSEWNLSALVGEVPPFRYLDNFKVDEKAEKYLEEKCSHFYTDRSKILSHNWQDLIKAIVAEQLFFRRNSVAHVAGSVIRPLRVLATCVNNKEPWLLCSDDVSLAIKVGKAIQKSGKLGDLIAGLIKTVFDTNHLLEVGPLYPAVSAMRLTSGTDRRAKFIKSQDELMHDLNERKRSERLPERRAFWELIRIVMTEKPQSYMDELRFAGLRIMIVSGFRLGEVTLLPSDWRRERAYYDASGRAAGELGGYSSSLMIRHFAEKQQLENSDSRVLFEKTQHVPNIFEEVVETTLQRVIDLTSPLRNRLKLQTETGRLFPQYSPNDLVNVTELYTQITGNPFWVALPRDETERWLNLYRENFSSAVLKALYQYQLSQYERSASKLDMAPYMFFNRLGKSIVVMEDAEGSMLYFRRANGSVISSGSRMRWSETYLKIGELENYIAIKTPTKLSDTQPLKLSSGEIQTWELLFLHPKRSLAEERNAGICDVERYVSIGRPDSTLLGLELGENKNRETIFSRYGLCDEDRKLTMTTHMLRHLQTTEMYRLGIADTIISKRFNRRSVAQSYVYDHRSLAEELDEIEIPSEFEVMLGDRSTSVAKMIAAGKASGPIVNTFKRLQKTEGDAAAFSYLSVEADGFHATPYGHCLNSFTVSPCPKHLECFNGCRHLSATNLPENRSHLIRLQEKLSVTLNAIEARTFEGPGRINQLKEVKLRLEGVRKLLSTTEGEKPFPDGEDLSTLTKKGVLDE